MHIDDNPRASLSRPVAGYSWSCADRKNAEIRVPRRARTSTSASRMAGRRSFGRTSGRVANSHRARAAHRQLSLELPNGSGLGKAPVKSRASRSVVNGPTGSPSQARRGALLVIRSGLVDSNYLGGLHSTVEHRAAGASPSTSARDDAYVTGFWKRGRPTFRRPQAQYRRERRRGPLGLCDKAESRRLSSVYSTFGNLQTFLNGIAVPIRKARPT